MSLKSWFSKRVKKYSAPSAEELGVLRELEEEAFRSGFMEAASRSDHTKIPDHFHKGLELGMILDYSTGKLMLPTDATWCVLSKTDRSVWSLATCNGTLQTESLVDVFIEIAKFYGEENAFTSGED